jgi:AcrR family transcriptional regulator
MARTAAKSTDERRDEILRVAEARLLEGGYKNMSVTTLANACRVSPAHLYNFFPAKIDIASALAERECHHLINQGREQSRSGKPGGRVKRLLLAELKLTFAFLEKHPAYLEVLERMGRERPQVANKLLAASRLPLSEILQAGLDDGSFQLKNVEGAAETIQIAMLKFRFPQLMTQLSLEKLCVEAEGVTDFLLKGIEAR